MVIYPTANEGNPDLRKLPQATVPLHGLESSTEVDLCANGPFCSIPWAMA